MLQYSDENIATFIKAKEALVYKSVFPKPLTSHSQEPCMVAGMAYLEVMGEKIAYALLLQSTTKVHGPNKINF